MKSDLKGVGLGFRVPLAAEIFAQKPKNIDWFEIITENFMYSGGKPRRNLEKLREDYPVVMHGVALGIGNSDPLDANYLKKLKTLAHWLQPKLVSDHLCWTSWNKKQSHDLLPVHYTRLQLNHIATRIQHVQDLMGRQILLENPSVYTKFCKTEMSEVDFLNELTRLTGCGILLDINNLFVNARNVGDDAIDYLHSIRHESVKQFHLAGHTEREDVCIDTHDHPVRNEVYDLYRLATALMPKTPTLLERDDKIPPLADLLSEIQKIREIHARSSLRIEKDPFKYSQSHFETNSFYPRFFEYTTAANLSPTASSNLEIFDSATPTPPQVGAEVYRNAYFQRLTEVLADTFKSFALVVPIDVFEHIATCYLVEIPPSHPSAGQLGKAFPDWFSQNAARFFENEDELPIFASLINCDWEIERLFDFEAEDSPISERVLLELKENDWQTLRVGMIQNIARISVRHDILPTLKLARTSDNERSRPGYPEEQAGSILIFRFEDSVHFRFMDTEEENLFCHMQRQKPWGAFFDGIANGVTDEVVQRYLGYTASWFREGLIREIFSSAAPTRGA